MSSITKRTKYGDAEAFFEEAMLKETDECIIWPYSKNADGYGVLGTGKKEPRHVHRRALIYHTGEPYSPKLHATHRPLICHNPSCFNYNHLKWATHKQNMVDKKLDKTNVTSRGGDSPTAKLTVSQVLEIREDNRLNKHIALDYGISRGYVSLIKRRVSWSWL